MCGFQRYGEDPTNVTYAELPKLNRLIGQIKIILIKERKRTGNFYVKNAIQNMTWKITGITQQDILKNSKPNLKKWKK